MKLFTYTKPKMIVADEGKHIRSITDVYVAEHVDEEGNVVPENMPYYSTTIFVPDDFTEELMNELYVEEIIGSPNSTFEYEETEEKIEEVGDEIEEIIEEEV